MSLVAACCMIPLFAWGTIIYLLWLDYMPIKSKLPRATAKRLK